MFKFHCKMFVWNIPIAIEINVDGWTKLKWFGVSKKCLRRNTCVLHRMEGLLRNEKRVVEKSKLITEANEN